MLSTNDLAFSLVDKNIYDVNGHGTMMHSIIKGYENKILGISPEVSILSIKVLNEDESIKKETIYNAIELAIENDATIINLSIASYKYDDGIAQLINKAVEDNITVISSSGDYSDSEVMFPASMDNVISVGALGKDLEILEMTSGGNRTVINAPGEDIFTLGNQENVFLSSGTSQSTALISGYIALVKDYAYSSDVDITNIDILNFLKIIKNKKNNYYEILELIKPIEELNSRKENLVRFSFLELSSDSFFAEALE